VWVRFPSPAPPLLWPNAQSRRFSAARKNSSAFRANPSVTLVHTDSFRSGGNRLLTDAIASGTDLAVSSIQYRI
jgi:hypothetical protein